MDARLKWTDETKAVVFNLWDQGHSAGEIGGLIGATRNAIIGLIARSGRKRPTTKRNVATPEHRKRLPKPKPKPELIMVPILPPPSVAAKTSYREEGKIVLADLEPDSCRWPIGDPAHKDFGFCGARADHAPYCPIHTHVAFAPPRSR